MAKITKTDEQSTQSKTTEPADENSAVSKRAYRKVRRGYVTSDKMDKTIVVEVIDRVRHPLYGKIVRRTKKFHAHDAENQAQTGDLVTIMETRPYSATKHFRLLEIVEKVK
jgi:small subunit ribosomal protein S17